MACVFCAIVEERLPASVFYADERFLGFLDIHPWRPGHALLIPRSHHERVAELPGDAAAALFALGVRAGEALRSGLGCDDVHFVLNDGAAASQTVPHVHLHVVPRWRGDLGRLFLRLAGHPLRPLLGAAPRERLDAQADAIRAAFR